MHLCSDCVNFGLWRVPAISSGVHRALPSFLPSFLSTLFPSRMESGVLPRQRLPQPPPSLPVGAPSIPPFVPGPLRENEDPLRRGCFPHPRYLSLGVPAFMPRGRGGESGALSSPQKSGKWLKFSKIGWAKMSGKLPLWGRQREREGWV